MLSLLAMHQGGLEARLLNSPLLGISHLFLTDSLRGDSEAWCSVA